MKMSRYGNVFRITGPFAGEIHRSLVDSPHKWSVCGAIMFHRQYIEKNCWINSRLACDLRRHYALTSLQLLNSEHYFAAIKIYMPHFMGKNENICTISAISHHWDATGSLNASWKTMRCSTHLHGPFSPNHTHRRHPIARLSNIFMHFFKLIFSMIYRMPFQLAFCIR